MCQYYNANDVCKQKLYRYALKNILYLTKKLTFVNKFMKT